MIEKYRLGEREYQVKFLRGDAAKITVEIGGKEISAVIHTLDEHSISIILDGESYTIHFAVEDNKTHVAFSGQQFLLERLEEDNLKKRPEEDNRFQDGKVGAPMPGKILKIFVEEGIEVKKNQQLFIIEAMKMENEVRSPVDGKIKKIYFKEEELVSVGEPIIEIEV